MKRNEIEKRPRQFAFGTDGKGGIAHLKTREERIKALGKVPEHLRAWVADLIEDAYQYSAGKKRAIVEVKYKKGKMK